MASKRPARREFLKGGAALASGLTVGAVAPALPRPRFAGLSRNACRPTDEQGQQGRDDRLRRALQARHLGAHSAREPAVARHVSG